MATETRRLPVKRLFSEDELNLIASQLATAVQERNEIADERKSAMDDFKLRTSTVEADIQRLARQRLARQRLARQRREGYETEWKECRLRRDYERKVRQYVDDETGEIVLEEPFTPDDRQNDFFREDA